MRFSFGVVFSAFQAYFSEVNTHTHMHRIQWHLSNHCSAIHYRLILTVVKHIFSFERINVIVTFYVRNFLKIFVI